MKTLLLYSYYTDLLSYFDDWMDAFHSHPAFNATCVNVFKVKNSRTRNKVKSLIADADLVVIHHSMNGDTLKYLRPFTQAIRNRSGMLVSFVGNELNLPTIGMEEKIKILKELEADIIATQLLEEAGSWLYRECFKSKVISLPHALNTSQFQKDKTLNDRAIDIGTRSAKYGVWLGDNERNDIISYFDLGNHDLKLDLGLSPGSKKRFNRNEWASFLNNCKATLSTEAGSYFLEPDDKTVNQVFQYLKKKSSKVVLPNDTILYDAFKFIFPQHLTKVLKPLLAKSFVGTSNIDQGIDFSEIHQKFFAETNKAPVHSKAISSRHFDAIGTHTLNVMYPGRYNDILNSKENYFELKRDHSNICELLELLNNDKRINEITSETYQMVLNNHTHKHRLDKLYSELSLLKPTHSVLAHKEMQSAVKPSNPSVQKPTAFASVQEKGILFIVGSLRTGGTENHISQVASRLKARCWRVEICLLSPYVEIKKDFLDHSIKIYRLPKVLNENWFYRKLIIVKILVLVCYSFLVFKVLLTRKNHFVHMFLPHAYIIGGVLSVLCRVPKKIMSRRSMNLYQKNYRYISYFEKVLHRKMDVILGNSKAVVGELENEGVDQKKLKLIYNGVNLKRFQKQNKITSRKRLGLLKEEFVMVVVANLYFYKGHIDLLKAMRMITDQIGHWRLLIIGDDRGEKSSLINAVESMGIEKNVIFMSEVKEIIIPLSAADLGIMCSHQEGFSNAILEYMAASLPVVATKVGGNTEAVLDGVNGYIVPPKSPSKLASAILKAYNSKNRDKIGSLGRSKIESIFNFEHCVDQYEKVYNDNV